MSRAIACLIVMGCVASEMRPIRVFHGLGDSCKHFNYPEKYSYIKCVETGEDKKSLMHTIEEMARKGCKRLLLEKETIQRLGVNFLCYSQGGLIARYILKICPEIAPFVKKVVFVGTPHLGITKIPEAKEFDFKAFDKNDFMFEMFLRNDHINSLNQFPKEWILKDTQKIYEENLEKQEKLEAEKNSLVDNELTAFFKDAITKAASYLSDTFDVKFIAPRGYLHENLGESAVIKELSAPEMDPIYANLELVLNILNQDERVIIPKESVTFGVNVIKIKEEGKKEVVREMYMSQYLNNHPHGLGKLYNENRLINCVSASAHAQLNVLDFRAIFNYFLIEDVKNNVEPLAKMSDREKKWTMESIELKKKEFFKNYPNFCQEKDGIPDEGFTGDIFDSKDPNINANTGINELKINGLNQTRIPKTMGHLSNQQNPQGHNRLLTSQPNDLSSKEKLRILV